MWEKAGRANSPDEARKEVNDYMNREDDIIIADGGDTQTWMGMTAQ